MVSFAERDEKVASADHLTLFDQLLGDLLRGAADELFVAEGAIDSSGRSSNVAHGGSGPALA